MSTWVQNNFDTVKNAQWAKTIRIVAVWKKDCISLYCGGTNLTTWCTLERRFLHLQRSNFFLFNLFILCSRYNCLCSLSRLNLLFSLTFQLDLIGSLGPISIQLIKLNDINRNFAHKYWHTNKIRFIFFGITTFVSLFQDTSL